MFYKLKRLFRELSCHHEYLMNFTEHNVVHPAFGRRFTGIRSFSYICEHCGKRETFILNKIEYDDGCVMIGNKIVRAREKPFRGDLVDLSTPRRPRRKMKFPYGKMWRA